MKTVLVSLWISFAMLAIGCGGTPSENAAEAPQEDVAQQTDTEDLAASSDSSADARGWEIQIEGQPKLSGRVVMVSSIGPITTYSLMGGDALTQVNIQDGGTDPHAVSVGFTESQIQCTYRAVNRGTSSGLTVTVTEVDGRVRGDLSGEISCQALGSQEPEVPTAKITGWFQK